MEKWKKSVIVMVSISALFFLTSLYIYMTFGMIDILGMKPWVIFLLCFCGFLSLFIAYLSWRYREWYGIDTEEEFLEKLKSESEPKRDDA